MKKVELEKRIKELEFELNRLKSGEIRKDSDVRLKNEEIEFRVSTLLNLVPAAIAFVDSETLRFRYVNDFYVETFGMTREKIIGRHIKDVVGEKNLPFTIKDIDKVRKGQRISFEEEFDTKNGARWFQGDLFPVSEEGKVTGIASLCFEISSRKQLEKEKAESDERFEQLFQQAPLGYQSLDINGHFIDVNQTWLELFGYGREEVIGKWFGDFLSPDYVDAFRERFPVFLEQGKIHSEFEMIRRNGEKLFIAFEGKVSRDDHGNFLRTHCILQDLTRLKLISALQKNDEFRLKFYLDHSPMGIIEYDSNFHIVRWAGESEKIFGWKAEEVVGKNLLDLKVYYEADIPLIKAAREKIRDGVETQMIPCIRCYRKDGALISCEWFNIVLKDENGHMRYFLSKIIDITERTQMEAELIQAKEKALESERLKSAFLANMSHEIRTPMNGIIGFARLLKNPKLSVEERDNFIKIISKSCERLLRTINAIIDISKIESGMTRARINLTDINEKLEFTYEFFKLEALSKGLRFDLDKKLPPQEAIINTDSEKLEAILFNLVSNAIKFTKHGSIVFGCERQEGCLKFHVKDTGIGISANHERIVFERFRQGSELMDRNYEGSGLGLSISKYYAKMLGGNIWFESQVGKGSTFFFTIPFAGAFEKSKIKEFDGENRDIQQTGRLKILIVEDDEISYSLLIRLIEGMTSEIIHAVDGAEAVQFCRENPDIDLVLMDIRMPEMNGLEATRLIRQFNKELIIIAQTAYGFASDCERALEAGCNDYISKPISKTMLIDLINKYRP